MQIVELILLFGSEIPSRDSGVNGNQILVMGWDWILLFFRESHPVVLHGAANICTSLRPSRCMFEQPSLDAQRA